MLIAIALIFTAFDANAATPKQLSDRLTDIRQKVMYLEQNLLESLRSQKQNKTSMKKIQTLLQLQKQERELSEKRLVQLSSTVKELESRRASLSERVLTQRAKMRKFLIAIDRSITQSGELKFNDEMDSPRRKVLSNLIDHGFKEIEILKADLDDADQLEARIQDESQQIAYLLQDLDEQAGVLELNRQLQADILQKRHDERVAQLESYRNLKSAEAQVEQLITQFNARLELERTVETEKQVSRAMSQSAFTRFKGKLPMPVSDGKVVSKFGRAYDAKSRLYIFRKGIDILAGKKVPVTAVSAGKIAYSGELANYGRVAIVDHGDHFYSLCAHLGELTKKPGDLVAAGDSIGVTDDSATPVYFEIRSRNVAVNPLQWVLN